jgi:hypothetical protein
VKTLNRYWGRPYVHGRPVPFCRGGAAVAPDLPALRFFETSGPLLRRGFGGRMVATFHNEFLASESADFAVRGFAQNQRLDAETMEHSWT